jgi:hypothetical protein
MLIVFAALPCEATTAVIIVTPEGVVAGIDNLITTISFRSGQTTPPGFGTKIAIVKERFVVASLGTEGIKKDGKTVYAFVPWIQNIESQLTSDISVTGLTDVIKNEGSRTFDKLHIDLSMQQGEIKQTDSTLKDFVDFFVVGYENGVPIINEVSFNFDWCNKILLKPESNTVFPVPNRPTDFYVFITGWNFAIKEFANPQSYAYERLQADTPGALKKIITFNKLTLSEAREVVRSLINTQAEVNPSIVGKTNTIITLPREGKGAVVN